MPLVEHLRELRRRLMIAVLAILIGTIVGWIIYPSAFEFLKQPYVDGIAPLLERKGFEAELVLSGGVGSAFSFRLKFALVIGLVISAPVWIGQIWALRPSGAAPQRAALGLSAHGNGRAAVRRRGGGRLLRAAQGHRGA